MNIKTSAIVAYSGRPNAAIQSSLPASSKEILNLPKT